MSQTNLQRGHARVSPARTVQNGIRAIETNLDETLAEGGTLLAQMMQVNKLGRLAPDDGQKAIDATIACLAAIADSRARAMEAHQGLRDAVAKIDLREMGWGGLDDSPPSSFAPNGEARSPLRIVREG